MTGAASSRLTDWLWFLGWALASSWACLGAAATLGATFDEPIYLRAGLEGWRHGTHEPLLRMGTMPLPVDLATLPLYLYERATGFSFDFTRTDLSQPLFWARATAQLFWWLLLFYAWTIGDHLAGRWAGRLAVAFLACEPNFLAHASLATTDIAAAATLLPTVYYFARGREQTSWRRRIGLPALWFGIALFAKASALAFGPLCWLVIDAHRLAGNGALCLPAAANETGFLARGRHLLRQFQPWWSDTWCIGLIGLAMVFILCGSDWKAQPSFVRWAHGRPEGALHDAMVWLSENLTIFSNAGHGLVYQIRHNMRGHSTFLLGEMAERSLWYYYPVLLSIKLPLPILLLPLVIVALRPRALGNWACAIAAGLLLYSLNCKVQIGIRLMLPWLALGIVGLAAALVRAWGESVQPWRRHTLATVGAACVAGLVAATASVWPHGLCFVNRLWGGPEHGFMLVSDSNYDWGQGLKELARWQKSRGVANLDVWYFGTDPLVHALPMRMVPLHQLSAPQMTSRLEGRYLAVGTTHRYGSYVPKDADALTFLRGMQPVARTQTFLIYDFTGGAAVATNVAQEASARHTPVPR